MGQSQKISSSNATLLKLLGFEDKPERPAGKHRIPADGIARLHEQPDNQKEAFKIIADLVHDEGVADQFIDDRDLQALRTQPHLLAKAIKQDSAWKDHIRLHGTLQAGGKEAPADGQRKRISPVGHTRIMTLIQLAFSQIDPSAKPGLTGRYDGLTEVETKRIQNFFGIDSDRDGKSDDGKLIGPMTLSCLIFVLERESVLEGLDKIADTYKKGEYMEKMKPEEHAMLAKATQFINPGAFERYLDVPEGKLDGQKMAQIRDKVSPVLYETYGAERLGPVTIGEMKDDIARKLAPLKK